MTTTDPGGFNVILSTFRDPLMDSVVRDFWMPSPKHLFRRVTDILLEEGGGGGVVPACVFADGRIVETVRGRFLTGDCSVVSAAKEMKRELRKFFASPVSCGLHIASLVASLVAGVEFK